MQPIVKINDAFGVPISAETVTLSAAEASLARDLLAKLLTVAAEVPALANGEGGSDVQGAENDHDRAVALARSVYQSRKRRSEHFGSALFSEPAWDMLLVLFIYGDRGERTSVSRLAEFSELPLTTAIRWLDYLESQRMITRIQCPTDRRKYFVGLSERGSRMMTNYFCSLLDAGTITLSRAADSAGPKE